MRKYEDELCDNVDKMEIIKVGDEEIVDIVRHYKYLGSYTLYYLRDEYNVDHRISKASAEMSVSQLCWNDHAVDLRCKYLILYAIPYGLLLRGYESLALREGLLQKVRVFLHWSIQKILQIGIMQLEEEKITIIAIRNYFFNVFILRH